MQELESKDTIKITSQDYSSLIVYRNLDRKNTGKYMIKVKNEYGSDSAEIDVVVLGALLLIIRWLQFIFE